MHYGNCGGCCGQKDEPLSNVDKKALLEEKKAILEAKLSTINHLIESVNTEKKE